MKTLKYLTLILILSGFLGSCEKFLDINDDPNNPTAATIIDLMPAGQVSIGFAFSNVPGRIGADAVQHMVVGRFDGWDVDGSDVSNDWRFSLYAGALKDFEDVIEQATASENFHYVGIAKLLKAYSYSLMVDMWDDIPFTQACGDFEYPEFDDASGIYDDIFLLIDEALDNMEMDNSVTLADVDLIYQGDVASWIRMGNTLKLKLYNQIRLVDPVSAKAGIEALVAAEAANPGEVLITSADQDFNFYFVNNANPENRHPSYQADYLVKGEAHICNFFYDYLDNNNDPRIPYYFYNQNADGFEGRNYGDPAPQGNDGDTRTVPGIYPVGGKFDDGSAEAVTGGSANGDGEFRMLTNIMRLYIEAEAALSMNAAVSGTAEELFKEAMEASFLEVNRLSAPDMISTDVDAYIQDRLDDLTDSTTVSGKLNLVMTEKWIAMFGNGMESFNDYRRTGFPVIPDPIETNNLRLLRIPYPNDELDANPNAPDQPNRNLPVFWDVDSK